MENRKARLFGYTTEANFKKLVKIIKEENLSQSSILHILIEELLEKYDAGKNILKGKERKRPGPIKKEKPPKKIRVQRY